MGINERLSHKSDTIFLGVSTACDLVGITGMGSRDFVGIAMDSRDFIAMDSRDFIAMGSRDFVGIMNVIKIGVVVLPSISGINVRVVSTIAGAHGNGVGGVPQPPLGDQWPIRSLALLR